MSNEFVKILKHELEQRGLSHRQAGKLLGCSGRLISYYIRGERMPTLDQAHAILKALGRTLEIGAKE